MRKSVGRVYGVRYVPLTVELREASSIKGGAKIDHETPAEWRFVAVQKVTTTLQFH